MLSLLVSVALAPSALAAEPVDIGVIKNEDVRVVQKLLYPKEDRTELGVSLGAMPFDGFTFAPQLGIVGVKHFSEFVAVEGQLGLGYGFKTARFNMLEGPAYGVAVEAYRYLASVQADIQYTPIYAKLNLGGGRILHHDVYVLGGLGATLEQCVLPTDKPGEAFGVSPTVPLGIGTRVWLGPNLALRGELRDSLMVEQRAISDTWGFKQNVSVSLGLSMFSKGGK